MRAQSAAAAQSPACRKCGGPTSVKSVMPLLIPPEIDEVTYVCDACEAETTVQVKARPSSFAEHRKSPQR